MLRLPRSLRAALKLCAVAFLAPTMAGCHAAPASPHDVLVAGTDYAFEIPKDLPAGPTHLQFVNRGRVLHEMALGQLHTGVTADSVLAYAASGHDPGDLADVVGILIAHPGEKAMGALKADLLPGRTYLMICSFRDADSLPPNMAMGMQASFVVK